MRHAIALVLLSGASLLVTGATSAQVPPRTSPAKRVEARKIRVTRGSNYRVVDHLANLSTRFDKSRLKTLMPMDLDLGLSTPGTVTSLKSYVGALTGSRSGFLDAASGPNAFGWSNLIGAGSGFDFSDASDASESFIASVFGAGRFGVAGFALSPRAGGKSYLMTGGSDRFYSSVEYSDSQTSTGSQTISMTEHYYDASNGSSMSIITTHENGKTTQEITYEDGKGNVTVEKSESGGSSSDKDKDKDKDKDEDDKDHPREDQDGRMDPRKAALTAFVVSKVSVQQAQQLHNKLWLAIRGGGGAINPNPIKDSASFTALFAGISSAAGIRQGGVINWGDQQVQRRVAAGEWAIDPKRIVDPAPAR